MFLEIETGKFSVKAIVQERDNCTFFVPVMDFLKLQYATNRSNVSGLKTFFKRYAKMGRLEFTSETFHEASKENDIWRFSKGQLRIYCFMDGDILILTHGNLKKTNKTDKANIDKAVREKELYFGSKIK